MDSEEIGTRCLRPNFLRVTARYQPPHVPFPFPRCDGEQHVLCRSKQHYSTSPLVRRSQRRWQRDPKLVNNPREKWCCPPQRLYARFRLRSASPTCAHSHTWLARPASFSRRDGCRSRAVARNTGKQWATLSRSGTSAGLCFAAVARCCITTRYVSKPPSGRRSFGSFLLRYHFTLGPHYSQHVTHVHVHVHVHVPSARFD